MKKSDVLIYSLSKKMLISLFVYYFVVLILGGIFAAIIACDLTDKMSQVQIMKRTFVLSIAVSGMSCSVQYIKRLYKACLTKRVKTSGDFIENIGNFTYFVFRPFFAFAFVIVMIFMLLDSNELILNKGKSKSGKFLTIDEILQESELEEWSVEILKYCFDVEYKKSDQLNFFN